MAELHRSDTVPGQNPAQHVDRHVLVVMSGTGGSNDPSRLRAMKPDVEIGVTVGAGHFIQLEVPEQVNLMIERFVRNLG